MVHIPSRECGGCNPWEGVGCYILQRAKNDTACKNFAVILCFMSIHSFVFPEMAGSVAPLATHLNPPLALNSELKIQVLYLCN